MGYLKDSFYSTLGQKDKIYVTFSRKLLQVLREGKRDSIDYLMILTTQSENRTVCFSLVSETL